MVLVLLVTGGILSPRGNSAWGSDAAIVRVGSGDLGSGQSITVALEVMAVPGPGLGAATIDIRYDAGVVDPTGCTEGPGGALDMTVCNTDYAPGTVRFTGIRATPGAVGDILLGSIAFRAVGEPDQCSDLTLDVISLADTDGNKIAPARLQSGRLCVEAPPDSLLPEATAPALSAAPERSVPTLVGHPAATAVAAPEGAAGATEEPLVYGLPTADSPLRADAQTDATVGPEATRIAAARSPVAETAGSAEGPSAAEETDAGDWTPWIVAAAAVAVGAALLVYVVYRRWGASRGVGRSE